MKLYQGQPGTGHAILATVGRAYSWFEVHVANTSGADATFRLNLYPRGGAVGVANEIIPDFVVKGNTTATWLFAMRLAEGDVFDGLQAPAGALSVIIEGGVGAVPSNPGFSSSAPLTPPGTGVGDMVLASVQTVTGAKTFGSVGAVGKLKLAGSTSGAATLDAPAVAGSAAIVLPGASGTLATLANAETFTNKRITKRIATLTDAATVTIDTDNFDGGELLTLSQATTFANPTGTPTDFQHYILRIKSTVSRALTYGTKFRGGGSLALPASTTGGGLTDYLGFQYNAADDKWDLLARSLGY